MRKFLKISLCTLAAVILIFAVTEASIIIFGISAKPKKSNCIIVLGCAVYGDFPSPFFQERLDRAFELYKNGYAKYIIVCGAKGRGENISEAEAGKRYLVEKGVLPELILKEEKSFSTYENLLYSKKIMKKKGFKSAIIVSNMFHLERAHLIAKKLKINASFSGVYVKQYLHEEYYGFVRESVALWYEILKILASV
ncbi:YdcF family protein [Anaerocellum danielii]|uniref:YdcF family protein n=1 Tax=Anaerocellum danielii TaxID=1387557 RepID=A0ABZ0U0Y3_9FIRM|nr:YdcF family protein [Caldicellulosiruptor danielii]WPX07830.1 YdcF family protein [Caldicellulosiruptor danielii]